MTAVATNLVADGTVRLEAHPSEPTHTLFLKPVDGGGLLLRNPSTGAWDMHSIAYDASIPSQYALDVYNCKIDGVTGQRAKRWVNDSRGQMVGPQSGLADVSVNYNTGLVTHTGTATSTPQWASAWYPRYARGDALGEKLYIEVQATPVGALMGIGLIEETQAPPLQPFNGSATFGSGNNRFAWYNNGAIYADNGFVATISGYGGTNWLGLAFDFVNNKVWVRNLSVGPGYWDDNASHDPGANVGGYPISTFAGKRVIPGCAFWAPTGSTAKFNFGSPGIPPGPFVGVIPSGFLGGWRKPYGAMYDVFASDNGSGGIALELCTVPLGSTGIAADVDTGFKIKSGDANKRLVGRCGLLLDADETGFNYPGDTTKHSMVCSYFKPQKRELGIYFLQGGIAAEYCNGSFYQNNGNGPNFHLDWVGFTKYDGIPDRLPTAVANVFAWGPAGSSTYVGIVKNLGIITIPAYADKGYIGAIGSTSLELPSSQFDDVNVQQSLCLGFLPFNGPISFEAMLKATVWE